jgi:hypothetical protein
MTDTDSHPPSTDLRGTWNGEVRFTAGPLAGDVHHESRLLADDGLLVHLRSRRGVGEWTSEGDHLSFAFYEVILNDAGKPNGVVHVTASSTRRPETRTFEGVGRRLRPRGRAHRHQPNPY